MMPRICGGGDAIALSWVRNSSADLMQESGTNTIYTAARNGESFEGEKILAQPLGTVEDFAAYDDGTGVKVLYAGQIGTEEKVGAVFDENNQVADVFSDLTYSAEDGSISEMHYVDGNVNFFLNGTLYSYHTSDNTLDSYHAKDQAFGSAARYCSNGEKGGYVWSMYDEETQTGRIVASMASETGYSAPVTLYEKQGVMWRYISPVLDDEGNWKFLTNAMQTGTGEEERHSLRYIEKKQDRGTELAGASIDEDDVANGLTGVDYFATNTGDTAIHSLQMDVALKDGTVISKEIPVTILPGESVAQTAYVDLTEIDGAQEVSISVYEEGQDNIRDCAVTDHVGLSDVAVSGTAQEKNGQVIVTADVSNGSAMDADTTLYLYGDEKQTKALCPSQTGIISANGNKMFQMTVSKKDITYNKNNAAYLTLKAVVKGGDYNEDNNTGYVVLYRLPNEHADSGGKPDTKAKVNLSRAAGVSLNATSYTYNGKPRQPEVTVKHGSKRLVRNKDYVISYKNNTNIGTASVTITGIGTYTGSVTKTFEIVPKGTVLSGKPKAGSKSFTARWKKRNKNIAGCQIQYSTNKKFTKKTSVIKTVKKKSATKLTVRKLKANKRYYFRIRTYQTVNKKKYCSAWSKSKAVKTKR